MRGGRREGAGRKGCGLATAARRLPLALVAEIERLRLAGEPFAAAAQRLLLVRDGVASTPKAEGAGG